MSIKINNVKFSYNEKYIINGCSFEIEKGKIYCILGPNGSGKTTLLKLLNGNLNPAEGNVSIEGMNISQSGQKEIAKHMSFVPQAQEGVFSYKVLELVVMGRNPHISFFSRPQKKDYEIAEKALKTVEILHLKERNYTQLSGGEKQLVFLARAIAQEANYFILDEPTSHLDFSNQYIIMNTLNKLVKEKKCGAVVAMHDPNLTLAYADEVIMIKNGKLFKKGITNLIMTSENLSYLYEMNIKLHIIKKDKKIAFA